MDFGRRDFHGRESLRLFSCAPAGAATPRPYKEVGRHMAVSDWGFGKNSYLCSAAAPNRIVIPPPQPNKLWQTTAYSTDSTV